MEEMKICLKKPDDVKEFVRAARKCEFDVDLAYNSAVVDGKSILGVFALGLEKPLVVSCPRIRYTYSFSRVFRNFSYKKILKQGFTNRKKSVIVKDSYE